VYEKQKGFTQDHATKHFSLIAAASNINNALCSLDMMQDTRPLHWFVAGGTCALFADDDELFSVL